MRRFTDGYKLTTLGPRRGPWGVAGISAVARRVREWLYPPTCVLCGGAGAPGRDLCRGCSADLPWIGAACEVCALPLPLGGVCGRCQHRPPPFDEAVAALAYRPPVDWLVKRFKFDGRLACGVVMGELLADAVSASDARVPEALIPVPLHPARLRERGFDQARELSRVLSRRLSLPVAGDCLSRTRATSAQAGLDAAGRRGNLRGAFRARKPPPSSVALVDDVLTTGSTVAECARALKRAGCERVSVWVPARA